MIKKFLLLLTAVSMTIGLVGCGGGEKKPVQEKTETKQEKDDDEKYVAFITDVGSIDDKSFNEGSWEGVSAFADSNGYKKDFFRPVTDTEEARGEAVDKAIEAGADVLVCCGSLFETVMYEKQTKYPDIEMLFIDGEPKKDDGTIEAKENVHSIVFKEEECGYLAGYAAVKEGYTKLGFLGGMDVPAVVRFGYGFVQGAEAAAKELNIKGVTIEYEYTGTFSPSDDITTKVKNWYDKGTEIIFSCGGGILYSVIEATGGLEDRKIIGVDVDQGSESENIVFSSMKGLTSSIKNALELYDKNDMKWPDDCAGKTKKVGIKEDGVGLSATEGSWRVKKTTIDDYNKMITEIKSKDLKINDEKLPELKYVKLNKVN